MLGASRNKQAVVRVWSNIRKLGYSRRDLAPCRIIRAPNPRRLGSQRQSHSRRDRSPGTQPPSHSPRPSRAAVERLIRPGHDCSGCCPE